MALQKFLWLSAQWKWAVSLRKGNIQRIRNGNYKVYKDGVLIKEDKWSDEYAQYYRALNLEEMNKLQDAVKQYRSLISKKPTFAPAYYSLAVILDNAENYREAVANYDKFISIKGNDKDEMTEFAISRAKELKEYLNQINASK